MTCGILHSFILIINRTLWHSEHITDALINHCKKMLIIIILIHPPNWCVHMKVENRTCSSPRIPLNPFSDGVSLIAYHSSRGKEMQQPDPNKDSKRDLTNHMPPTQPSRTRAPRYWSMWIRQLCSKAWTLSLGLGGRTVIVLSAVPSYPKISLQRHVILLHLSWRNI